MALPIRLLGALAVSARFAVATPPAWVAEARPPATARGAVRQVETFAKGGNGSPESPWTGWEGAFASVPSTGARIEFKPGAYRQQSEIRVPIGLTGWLYVIGRGATVTLTAQAPRFLDPDLTADHQTVRRVWIEGLTIDAAGVGGKDHVIFGNYVDGGGIGGFRRVDWDRIVVKDVRAFGLVVDPTTRDHRGGIAILSAQSEDREPKANTIEHIYLEGVRVEGGNWGILVDGIGLARGDGTNVDIDDVWLVRCWHSLLARQPGRFASSNFQVGEAGRVGHVHVIDCYGQFSGDTGLELNATGNARVTGTTIEDAAAADFYYTNYNTPPAEPDVLFDHCVATVTGRVADEYGVGWRIINSYGSVPAGGRFRIENSRFTRTGTTQATSTGAGVTASGKIRSLSISGSEFDLSGVELSGLARGQRVLELDFAEDVAFRLRDVKVKASGTRSAAGSGLNAITTQAASAGKTITLDWDDVAVSVDVAGAPESYTIFTTTIYSTLPSVVRGKIRGYRVDSVSGDDHACAINVDLATQRIGPSLDISAVDGRKLPPAGEAVRLNNAEGEDQKRKVSLRGIRGPRPD